MTPGMLIAGALLRLASAQVATYELGATSEVRGVSRLQAGRTTWLAEADLTPRVALKLETRTLVLDVTYAPNLWYTTPTGNVRVLQNASLRTRYHPDPRYLFTLGATGSMGVFNMLAPTAPLLPGTPPPSLQAVGQVTQVHYVFGEALAGAEVMPTRRTRLALQAGYRVTGGDGAVARASLPLQYGPRGGLTFELATAPTDLLISAATLASSRFDTSPPYPGAPPWRWRRSGSARSRRPGAGASTRRSRPGSASAPPGWATGSR